MTEHPTPRSTGAWLALAAAVVVVATVATAIATMGSPWAQRDMRLDERRVADLRRIDERITTYYTHHGSLPPTLDVLASQPGLRLPIVDPVSAAPYRYEIIDAQRYRLCAVFTTDSAAAMPRRAHRALRDWPHAKGEHCFDRKIPDDGGN